MTSDLEKIVRDRMNRLSGKEFQQKIWDVLSCVYDDFHHVKMQSDLGNDGYSLKEGKFFAVYAIEPGGKYDNNQTVKKISNPKPSKSEELGDYDKFLKNWKSTNNFKTWIFITKENLMGRPHQKIADLNNNGDGISKENWGIDKIIKICTKIDNKSLFRIFELSNLNVDSRPSEVETIIDLVCYISENADLIDSNEFNDMPDPDRKLERFLKYCDQLKKEIVDGITIYSVAQKEAEKAIGLDKISIGKKVLYLKGMSRRFLRENAEDPIISLDKMTDYLNVELSKSGKNK